MDEKFAKNYSPTIGVDVTKINIVLDNNLNKKPEKVAITVWDIAGQETFKSFRRTFYNGATAGILMFDVTVKESFCHIKDWLHEAQTEIGKQVPFILVGNKIDLKRKRKINLKEMELLQQKHQNIVMIYETSAKTNKNIRELFRSIAETVLKDVGRDNKKKNVLIQSNHKKLSTQRKKVASARSLPPKFEKI
jgi:Ras-related protein Rab-2A